MKTVMKLSRKRNSERNGQGSDLVMNGAEFACKRLKEVADLDPADQVRSNDGATKLLDGNTSLMGSCDDDKVQDTVGVVVLDRFGSVASTVSSGGIALKQPGRVGQASCFGCGCWAQRRIREGSCSTAVSTTGCGEHLLRTFLARECGEALSGCSQPLQESQRVMKEKFAESEFLQGVPEKLGGAVCMQYDNERGQGEFLWTHTTASMGIGFQSTHEEDATVKMSRLPPSSQQGTTILVEAVPFRTSRQ